MKKFFACLIILIFSCSLILSTFIEVKALSVHVDNFSSEVVFLRAGGGSSGGGSSGGSSGGGSHTHSNGRNYFRRPVSILGTILHSIIIGVIFFGSFIVFYLKVVRSSINSRRLLKILKNSDKSWNYKLIEKCVIDTYYIVQECWTKMDMEPAFDYLSDDLYEEFKIKLEWMKMGNRRNILKKISLVDLKPVSVYDDNDDSKDLIWFYIKGKMIDYTINTETNEKLEGNDYSKSFVEFWKFVKTSDDKWVLDKILQEDERDKIKFQDNCK